MRFTRNFRVPGQLAFLVAVMMDLSLVHDPAEMLGLLGSETSRECVFRLVRVQVGLMCNVVTNMQYECMVLVGTMITDDARLILLLSSSPKIEFELCNRLASKPYDDRDFGYL